jgi:ribonucleotide reductase alpha subunit
MSRNDSSRESVNNIGAEQILEPYESCNLSEIFLNRVQSEEEFRDIAQLLYKAQKAVTQMPYLYPESAKIIHKNARIGIGITGITQSLHKLHWLAPTYQHIRAFDTLWSKQRGWNTSIKITTVKPSGTLSLLAGSSAGVHPAFAPYYIRRMRIASNNALVPYARHHGYHVAYQKNFDGTDDYTTCVIDFPCHVADAIYAKNMTAVEQLALVKQIQTLWSDSSVSVTVYYRKHEVPAIQEWLKAQYETSVKSVSFLLHSDHGFVQAPYEEITQEHYAELMARIVPLTPYNEYLELDTDECATGTCPIR